MTDEILTLARDIKRLASADHFDLDDLKPIWQKAKAIETAREAELDEADFFTELSEQPPAQFEDMLATHGRYN